MIGDNIMLAVPVKDSFNDNMKLNLYCDDKKKVYGYLGLYINKSIRAIGKVTKVAPIRIIDGVLYIDTSVTNEEKSRIFEEIKRWKTSELNSISTKIFFVDKFYETDYKNIGTIGIMGSKKFKLDELFSKIPETTEEIANQLKGKTFELKKNNISSLIGGSFENCVALAKKYGINFKQYSNSKITHMRLVMALKSANVFSHKNSTVDTQKSQSQVQDDEYFIDD